MSKESGGRGLTRARVRLLAGLVLVALFSAMAIGLALTLDYSNRTTDVRDEISQDATTSANYVSAELDRQLDALVLIANSAVVQRGDRNESEAYFARIRAAGPVANDLWLVSSDGTVVATTTGAAGLPLGDRPYVAQALAGKRVIGDAITGRVSGRPIIPLGAPVIVSGQVVGAVFTQAPLDDPNTFGQALSFLARAASIQNSDGALLYDDGAVANLAPADGAAAESSNEIASTVAIAGTPGWTITVSEATASAYADARQYLLRGAIAVGVALLVALILLWRAWLTITRLRDREHESQMKLQAVIADRERRRRSSDKVAQIALRMERHQGYADRADALLASLLDDFADFATIETDDGLDTDSIDDAVQIRVRHADPRKDPLLAELRRDFYEAQPPHQHLSGGRLVSRPFRLEAEPDTYDHHAHGRALQILDELRPGSLIGVPLRTAHGGRAALVVGRTYGRPAFSADDMEFLSSLGGLAGLVLETGMLHDADRLRSVYLQENLLPPGLPEDPAYCVAARYIPCERGAAAGGDWYDAYAMPGPHLLLTVGDVVGHGVEAAAAMGKLRSALRALAEATSDPALMLQRLDRLAGPMRSAQSATAFVGVLNVETGLLMYSNAGHPLPVLSTRSGTTLLDGTDDLPLVVETRRRNVGQVQLTEGDVLVLYTDGLIETRTDDLREREETLRSAVRANSDRPLKDLLDSVLQEVPPEGSDDVCLLTVRWLHPREGADAIGAIDALDAL